MSQIETLKVINALNNYISTLEDDAKTVKDYPHLKIDFENQINEIKPIIVSLEHQLDEIF